MKIKYTYLLLALSFSVLANLSAQTIQATIKAGTIPNSIIIAIKPSAPIVGSKLSTAYFSIAVPSSANPRPTVSVRNNNNTAISYTIENVPGTESISGTPHWVYNFLGDGSQASGVEKDLAAADNDMLEIAFSGGVGSSEVKIVSLPQGGSTSNSYLNIFDRGNDRTNVTAMFYGGTPTNSAQGYNGLSFTQIANILLPVKFLSFYALKNDDNAKLNWTVEGDEDNKYFEVERSTDGRVFKPLSKINAMGNGRSVNTYETVDQRLSALGANTVFYRIKQTDINGNIVYSSIKNLNATRKSTPVQILPNPAKTTTKLVFDADNAGKGTILVRDMQGKLVLQYNTTLVKGINQQEMNVSALASGDYNVTVSGDGFTHLVKMSKIN